MRTGNWTRAAATVALALSLTTLTACGDDGDGADPAAAAPKTADTELEAATEAAEAAGADAAAAASSSSAAPSSRYDHQFSETYAGPVWITIATDAATADVMLSWGPYSVSFEHQGSSASYWFTKSAADAPGAGVPVTLMVAPAAAVTFHEGEPPADAIDVNEGWAQAG